MKMLATRQVPLEDLAPYPGNARLGDEDLIGESLDAHDQYRAIVVWADDTEGGKPMQILAGNHTYLAAGNRGRKRLLCHLIACDADEAKRINLVDNRANDVAGYDRQQLADLLQSLEGDYTGTGFDEKELEHVLAQIAADEGESIGEPTWTCPSCGHVATAKGFKPGS